MEVKLPDGFNEETDKCPIVILMHGIFSSKDIVPIPALARALAKEGTNEGRNEIFPKVSNFNSRWRPSER